MKIERILIPTDFSETAELAVAHGAYMARLFNAKIFLLHVIESNVYASMAGEPVYLIDVNTEAQEAPEEKLYREADEITKKYNVELYALTTAGKPAKGIAEVAGKNNIDIIIMGTHGTSGFEEFIVGSNTNHVVNLVSCPVISVQKFAKEPGFSNIIMPIDNDLHSRQKVNNVVELAREYKSMVHILGLLETDDETDEKKFEIKLDTVEHALKHAGIPFNRKLVRADNLATEAMKYAEEENGDLIVTMTGHESTLSGIFLGAFAKQIVNHSKIPVMSIKPEQTTVEFFDPIGGSGVLI
jgi:nucleotide-binding universal stress UspA family protein